MSDSLYLTRPGRSGRLFFLASLFLFFAWASMAQTVSFFTNGANWTVNQSGLPSAGISGNVLNGTIGGGEEFVDAWYDNEVSINAFNAAFTYQNVNGVPGNDADGASFDLQESGAAYLNSDGGMGGTLGIFGLTPSANWEINIYGPNTIGTIYNTDGATGGYQVTGGVDVANGDPINVTIVYAPGGAVQESFVDATTGAVFTNNYTIGNLVSLLGSSNAYIGLTMSSGGVGGIQNISNFTYQVVTNTNALAVVTNLTATGIDATQATLGGQVFDNGSFAPTITICYGPANGGSDASSWANSVTLGLATAAFSQIVTGLSPNTTYYYTVEAVNFAGTSWVAPSGSFTTPPVAPPQVANEPATAIGGTVATLNGQVLSTGGATASVIIYYGPSDGGTDASAWAQDVALGAQTGAFSQTVLVAANTTYYFTAQASNGAGVAWATPSLSFATSNSMTPIALTGFNLDIVIPSNAAGPPYNSYAQEYNPGEGTCFYQFGLPGTTYGLPASGQFNSANDGTLFQFQPYTTNNALVMSSETGLTSGTLTFVNPATYNTISLIANSASAASTSTGALTVNFADGTTYSSTFDAADWFNNTDFALQGVDRINIADGAADGGPTNPRFYQTTLDLSTLLGATNKAIASLTFGEAADAGATAVYAVSGYLSASNTFTLAEVTNLPATEIQPTTATLNGQVVSTGGFAPTVTLYYGPSNGGSNGGSWANSIVLGVETGTFNQAVTGLSPNTVYYYTFNAVNYAGSSWASPSESFTTTTVTLPQVANDPATAIGGTLATLNGQVLSTGGSATSVILYFGPTDGGASASAWSNNIALGVQSGAFAQTVGSLSTNTTYYFTAEATNSAGSAWATPSLSFTTLSSNPLSTLTAILTYHNDNTRMGVNSNETILTPANVNTNTFGKIFSYTLDGFVYAQPLIMTNVNIPGKGTHNVVYVVTEHDSVYAFDADNNSGANASPLWQTSFLGPNVTTVPSGDVESSDITPEIGITSTPVIDPVSGTIYSEVKTLENGTTFVHRLHALDMTTGLERSNFNSPVVIQCTNYLGSGDGDNDGENPPHVLWNPLREHSRPALTLLNGVVYVSFASHGDNGPYHGWLFGYNATNLSLTPSVYNSTPNGGEGGFWEGGGGPSVDAQGNLYLQTGNGDFDQITAITSSNNYGMSLIKFATTNGIQMVDFFAPSNAVSLSGQDQDLGSSAPLILPDSAGSVAHPHLVVGGGKTTPIYLVDRDNMGRWNAANDNQIVQQWNGGPGGDRDVTPAFFNNTLYIIDANNNIGAYSITNALFNTTPVETPDGYDNKGGVTPCISANGASNAIMWAIYNEGGETPTDPCILRAYNATNINQELYTSDQLPSRDSAGDAVKFIAPAIANGKVYVGAQYSLTVYGLAQTFVGTPVISPDGGVFTNSVTVTLSDPMAGASIYYTLDGTVPTTNSILYSAPFALTNSSLLTADAFKPGAVASGTASASFINSSAVGNGTGLSGQYWANTAYTAFIAPGFDAAPTLTRVDPTIDFNWDTTPPAADIGLTNYVVQWTGAVEPQFSETYTFSTSTDDGALLYVNGQLLVSEWQPQGQTTWSGTIALVAQQRYNIEMDYFQAGGDAVAELLWSSPSIGPMTIIPESQLYPVTNPPPSVALTGPTNGATYTASASVSLIADAAAQYNSLNGVSFYIGSTLLGTVSNAPYSLTTTGLAAGSYTLTAVAVDGSGLSATSAPVSITVNPATGLPYGLTNYSSAPAFYNMPSTYTNGTIPTNLSQTGVFANTPDMVPAASLIPYAPIVQLFSDNAQKVRYFSIPNTGAPYTPSEQIAYAPTNTWSFPSGTVFVKTFELETNSSDPNSLLRLETRLLVRDTNGAVYGVTYKWRSDYSDADLLTTNLTEPILIQTPAGAYTNLWYYPSPSDCLQCHTAVANYVLGLNARQLNTDFSYPNGVTDNELRSLNRTGLLYPAINEATITNIEQLSALTNLSASYVQRARSYLDANCAQCHQPGGPGPTFDARYDTPLANQNIIGVAAVKGNLGYDNMDIVTPDDVWRSSIYDRMNEVNPPTQMPPLARNLIDTNAVQVMADWINSLPGTPALPPPTLTPPGGIFQGLVSVTLQDPSNDVTMYYTLDGSLPTTNSTLYTGPFLLTNSATINANAWAPGYIDSVVGVAQFTILPGAYFTGPGDFTNGTFQMSVAGPVGSNYVLQVSTNLLQWRSISTNTSTTSPFGLDDPTTSSISARFYRVLQEP
jgi:uncharacterized repeat protein (TIGR03806 family)